METDPPPNTDPEDLSKYKLDEYDNEPDKIGPYSTDWNDSFQFVDCGAENGLFSNIKGLTYYKDNSDDPYITLKDVRRPAVRHFDSSIHFRLDRTTQKNVKSCKYTALII